MNEKELKQLADTELERDLAFALRWSRATPLEPDIAAPSQACPERTTGFVFNAYTANVSAAWSERGQHGDSGFPSGSQDGIALYSTRKLALMALRHAVERGCAAQLLRIDQAIAKEGIT